MLLFILYIRTYTGRYKNLVHNQNNIFLIRTQTLLIRKEHKAKHSLTDK